LVPIAVEKLRYLGGMILWPEKLLKKKKAVKRLK
jgi:hypothetical protein